LSSPALSLSLHRQLFKHTTTTSNIRSHHHHHHHNHPCHFSITCTLTRTVSLVRTQLSISSLESVVSCSSHSTDHRIDSAQSPEVTNRRSIKRFLLQLLHFFIANSPFVSVRIVTFSLSNQVQNLLCVRKKCAIRLSHFRLKNVLDWRQELVKAKPQINRDQSFKRSSIDSTSVLIRQILCISRRSAAPHDLWRTMTALVSVDKGKSFELTDLLR
jgi:hypothetical protein